MAITLIKQTANPNMLIMITVSLVVHFFLFLHIKEIYRLKQDFKKPEPPIKIEVMLQDIPKPAPIATAPLAAIPPPVVETPPPVEIPPTVVESIPVITPPPITEDSRISQPGIPIPEPVKEKKEEIKVVKKKVIVEQKKKPVKKIQQIEKRVEAIAKVPPMPAPVPLPHSYSLLTTTTQNRVAQNRVSQKNAAQPVVKAPALVKAPIASQSDKLLAKAYFNSMRLMIEKNKRYPQMARRRNQEGSVRVRFIIDSNGNVNSLEIVKGVDYESLNKAALEAVRRSAPFAKPPASISRDALKLELTINFKLI